MTLSLRARLALTFTVATALLVATVALVVQVLIGRALLAQVDDALDEQSELLLLQLAGEDETAEIVEDLAETRLPPRRAGCRSSTRPVGSSRRAARMRGPAGSTPTSSPGCSTASVPAAPSTRAPRRVGWSRSATPARSSW